MKEILITGVNSYVGNQLDMWLKQWPKKYKVHKISLRDGTWKDKDFSNYDSIVHMAGLVHKKETKENREKYYEINRDLTYGLAKKAKEEKVKQFIFLSTMSVYGLTEGVIDKDTPLEPKTPYGKSKLEAERLLQKLSDEEFKAAIVRPPMIYGKDWPGNYLRLRKLAIKTPIFPKIDNKRSMIYIDNLSEFLRVVIDRVKQGIFCPQNKEYVNTSELVEQIAKTHNKKIHLTKLFNPIIDNFSINIIKKVFGNLIYTFEISTIDIDYHMTSFKRGIRETENME